MLYTLINSDDMTSPLMNPKKIKSTFYSVLNGLYRCKSNRIRGIAKAVKAAINDPDVIIKTQKNRIVDCGILVSGMYYPDEDQDNLPPIKIFLLYHPDNKINLDKIDIEWLSVEITETLIHERRHQQQYRARKYAQPIEYRSYHGDTTFKTEQEYLGSEDEIDAFAHSIAVEIFLRKSTRMSLPTEINKVPEFGFYTEAFGEDSPIVANLQYRVEKLLKKLDKSFI